MSSRWEFLQVYLTKIARNSMCSCEEYGCKWYKRRDRRIRRFDLELDEALTPAKKKDGIENEVASKKMVSFVRDDCNEESCPTQENLITCKKSSNQYDCQKVFQN